MHLRPNLILLLVIAAFNSAFSQDKLIKRDGTILEVKITEISGTEIKYKMFDNLEGPLYTYPKSDFIRAEYKNGDTDVFTGNIPETQLPPTSGAKQEKAGDWIKFNIDLGVAVSKSFNGIPVRLDNSDDKYGNGDDYSKNSGSSKDHLSPYVSLNFILGKGKVLKHVLGVSYLNVKTNYDHSTASGFTWQYINSALPYYAQSTNVSVSGNFHIIALNSGLSFQVDKGFNLCLLGSIGITAKGTLISNGSRIDYTTVADTVYPGYKTTSQTTAIKNERSDASSVGFFSIQAKACYDFKIKENVLGVYLLGNISVANRLPYCAVGLSWYPFKKLRVTDL